QGTTIDHEETRVYFAFNCISASTEPFTKTECRTRTPTLVASVVTTCGTVRSHSWNDNERRRPTRSQSPAPERTVGMMRARLTEEQIIGMLRGTRPAPKGASRTGTPP